MLGNKETIAKNIRRYMEINGVNSTDVCKALNFKQSTFSNWINAKIYPRIDKIEKLANYFRINKADLVEDYPVIFTTNDEAAGRIMEYVNLINSLSPKAREELFGFVDYLKSKED